MANSIHKNNINAVFVLGIVCVMLLIQKSGATDFAIGGSRGWAVPDSSTHYSQWAEGNRFQIGDSIVFNYSPGQDSVLRVTQDDYNNCNTDSPSAEKYSDGHTAFKFNQSGPFYFISGNKDNCLKNEKVLVIVLADRSNRNATPPSPSNSTDMTPSPAPSGEASPPPTPAPETSPPPPNAASSIFMSFVGSVGAFAASSTLLLL
ncbi:early nodulin-like protein 9 [Pyrus communis]|uniref:early nodulin-like protein 9 n=1 Tax=Pyrus communis TaxID=23211 RepID=UPI0035BEFBF2